METMARVNIERGGDKEDQQDLTYIDEIDLSKLTFRGS